MHRNRPNTFWLIIGQGFILSFLILLLQLLHSQAGHQAAIAYLDPALATSNGESRSVIVTGVDLKTAETAVTQAGSKITSKLWLIDAVAAALTPAQIDAVASQPGILSVVANKEVRASSTPSSTYQWEGWVTDRRNFVYTHTLQGRMPYVPVVLPDGAVFALVENGDAMLLNMDGTLRSSIRLSDRPFNSAPMVDASGVIYLAGETTLHAINPDGSLRWQTQFGSRKYNGGIALGTNTLFLTDNWRRLAAFSTVTGQMLWETQLSTHPSDFVRAAPTVAADSTLYVVSYHGDLFAINPADGSEIWKYSTPFYDAVDLAPQVGDDGTIYVTGNERVYAINSNGSLNYQFQANSTIVAQPALGQDGSLYFGTLKNATWTEGGILYGLNPDGTQRFALQDLTWAFESSPVLSPDDARVYAVIKDKRLLLAVDTASGAIEWVHTAKSFLAASPTLAPNGNLHLSDLSGNYEIITPDKLVVYHYDGFKSFQESPVLSLDGSVFFHDGEEQIVVLSRIPVDWHSQVPHVEPTSNPNVYKVANPMSIDLGADVAHDNGVTGAGVTVAVVDSGVYFDPNVQNTLGITVQQHFQGQADFVGPLNCSDTMTMTGGSPSSCFTDYTNSQDGYGHGSHVAGIIWNNVRDYYTGARLGIAPEANVLSIRVLDDTGTGSYADVIEGIQYVITHTHTFSVRVINLSLSGSATTPYFVDPLNRAVEAAWAHGIVVVAAAGNNGAAAETITVPGNDPYVLTVGSLNSQRTPGYWPDDSLSSWSSTGPTLDGFIKPDILVPGGNVVSYMYNDPISPTLSAYLVQSHPDYALNTSLFRMNGTSMATAVASGVVALVLDAHPTLTPDQVKFRLLYAAQTAQQDGELAYSPLRQGLGRIWVPDAVFDKSIPADSANKGMDILQDLAHPWSPGDDPDPANNPDLAFHYEGPVQRMVSDNGTVVLYYVEDVNNGNIIGLGATTADGGLWLDDGTLFALDPPFNGGQISWGSGGYLWSGGGYLWSGGGYLWSGGGYLWSGGGYLWSGGGYLWSGGGYLWSGRYIWSGSSAWQAGINAGNTNSGATAWVDDLTCASPAQPVNLAGTVQNQDLILFWAEHPVNGSGYDVHRSPAPYFTPVTATLQASIAAGDSTLYIDSGIMNSGSGHFYVIQAHNCDGTGTAVSNRVGNFTYQILPGAY